MDLEFVGRAVGLARRNVEAGLGGPFGAVVVRDGKVLGEGGNRVVASSDPTAHAEVVAIRAACGALGTPHLEGATLYTSCEPCPMCLGAAYWAQVSRIVYALDRVDAEEMGFADRWIYDEYLLPLERRRIPVCRVAVPDGRGLVEAWNRSPLRRLY